jgi:hypothetical protein
MYDFSTFLLSSPSAPSGRGQALIEIRTKMAEASLVKRTIK